MGDSILTVGELDALRSAVETDLVSDSALLGEGGVGGPLDGEMLPRYRLGEGRVTHDQREERLSWVFDRAARALENRLADVMERAVTCSVTFLKVTRFAEFRETFEVDVRELAMLGFAAAGQPGQGLLAVEPEIIEHIVEGMMGGGSLGFQAQAPGRMFRSVTNLDLRVSRRVLGSFLDDLGEAWNPKDPLRLTVNGTDASGVVARSWDDSVPVVAALMEVAAGKRLLGMVGIVVPRGVVDTLADPGRPDAGPGTAKTGDGPLRDEVPDFRVDLQVQLGSRRMTVRELLALVEGDVLFLERRPEAIGVVQGVPKFLGVPGRKNGNKAVCVTQVHGREVDHA